MAATGRSHWNIPDWPDISWFCLVEFCSKKLSGFRKWLAIAIGLSRCVAHLSARRGWASLCQDAGAIVGFEFRSGCYLDKKVIVSRFV